VNQFIDQRKSQPNKTKHKNKQILRLYSNSSNGTNG